MTKCLAKIFAPALGLGGIRGEDLNASAAVLEDCRIKSTIGVFAVWLSKTIFARRLRGEARHPEILKMAPRDNRSSSLSLLAVKGRCVRIERITMVSVNLSSLETNKSFLSIRIYSWMNIRGCGGGGGGKEPRIEPCLPCSSIRRLAPSLTYLDWHLLRWNYK